MPYRRGAMKTDKCANSYLNASSMLLYVYQNLNQHNYSNRVTFPTT